HPGRVAEYPSTGISRQGKEKRPLSEPSPLRHYMHAAHSKPSGVVSTEAVQPISQTMTVPTVSPWSIISWINAWRGSAGETGISTSGEVQALIPATAAIATPIPEENAMKVRLRRMIDPISRRENNSQRGKSRIVATEIRLRRTAGECKRRVARACREILGLLSTRRARGSAPLASSGRYTGTTKYRTTRIQRAIYRNNTTSERPTYRARYTCRTADIPLL